MITTSDFFEKRHAGILLHITSLPGTPGNGDLGDPAYFFIDFLKDCGLSVWQMLPIYPPHRNKHQEFLSPYQCQSAHAGNPLLINLERLVAKGWLREIETPTLAHHPLKAIEYRYAQLKEAYKGFLKQADQTKRLAFAEFVDKNKHWLDDYALFLALKDKYDNAPWWKWPDKDCRDCKPQALEKAQNGLSECIEQHKFEQFVFFQQWRDLQNYANDKGIYLFGDMPIFMAHDSADVWAHRQNFLLDVENKPTFVAGAAPDYFCENGHCWGNPVYNWENIQADGFQWWINRFQTLHQLFDLVRLSYFRGFETCYAIPNTEPIVAKDGKDMKVPGEALFKTLQKVQQKGEKILRLIAEDLGKMPDTVTALRDKFGLPGIRVLQLGFDSGMLNYNQSNNPNLPHNHRKHSVIYTGTHDNNPTLGWFEKLTPEKQQEVCRYLNAHSDDMPWPLIQAAFASTARLAIIPMQDILALDIEHRMNTPGKKTGNWRWRFEWSQKPKKIEDKLRRLAEFYGRE
jgi:4-alpha-glucanotransferase